MLIRTLCSLVLLTFSASCRADQTLPAVQITKDKNKNIVRYDAHVTGDCKFAGKDPFEIYWLIDQAGGKPVRQNLNLIEKSLYRLDIASSSESEIVGQVKALEQAHKNLPLHLQLKQEKRKCLLKSMMSGAPIPEEMQVSTIRLENFNGQKPGNAELIGKNARSGRPARVKMNLK